MTRLQQLASLAMERKRAKHPTMPYLPVITYTDASANGLTRAIIDFLNFTGHQAERISTTGRPIDSRTTVTNVIGQTKQIGSIKWIKGSGKRGSADVSATIKGRSVKIEIKIGTDRQSPAQKEYQAEIEAAGGYYWIATSFDQFYLKYAEFIHSLHPKKI